MSQQKQHNSNKNKTKNSTAFVIWKVKYGMSDYENQLLPLSRRTFWFLSLWIHLSCRCPRLAQPPALHPGCLTHVISPPAVPFGLGEAQKASLALPEAALVAYLNQPLPQPSTRNYRLYILRSLNAKILSSSHFPYTSIHYVRVCASLAFH